MIAITKLLVHIWSSLRQSLHVHLVDCGPWSVIRPVNCKQEEDHLGNNMKVQDPVSFPLTPDELKKPFAMLIWLFQYWNVNDELLSLKKSSCKLLLCSNHSWELVNNHFKMTTSPFFQHKDAILYGLKYSILINSRILAFKVAHSPSACHRSFVSASVSVSILSQLCCKTFLSVLGLLSFQYLAYSYCT